MAQPAERTASPASPLQLAAAYAVCRSITRAAAKNFYYSFLVLPRRKRDAICAVYAFMRHADDISDDPQMSDTDKRAKLSAWLEQFHLVVSGQLTDDPVFMALAHAQRRFNIPLELLEKLVFGTGMDVRPTSDIAPGTPVVLYRTFDELYQYCYHVASVVGLVCIRIFGYREGRAEHLAERTGLGFQITNIIRDIKEDAAMGRVYLPQEDLDRFGVTAQQLAAGSLSPEVRTLLLYEAERAREYYKAGFELVEIVDHDSRAALWVLVTIYSNLLEKIARAGYNVFGPKIRLTAKEKLKILARGFVRRLYE